MTWQYLFLCDISTFLCCLWSRVSNFILIAQIEGTVTRHWEVTAVSIRLVDGSTWPGMLRRRPNKRQKAPSFMVTKVQPAGFYLINAPSSTFCFLFLGVLQIILKGLLICWLFGVGWREYSLISNRLSMIIWLWNCPQAWWFIYVRIVPTPSDVHKTQYVTMSRVLVDILGALGHYGGEFTASSSCEIMQIGVDIGAKCKMHS